MLLNMLFTQYNTQIYDSCSTLTTLRFGTWTCNTKPRARWKRSHMPLVQSIYGHTRQLFAVNNSRSFVIVFSVWYIVLAGNSYIVQQVAISMNPSRRQTRLVKASIRQIAPLPVPPVSTPPKGIARLHHQKQRLKTNMWAETQNQF